MLPSNTSPPSPQEPPPLIPGHGAAGQSARPSLGGRTCSPGADKGSVPTCIASGPWGRIQHFLVRRRTFFTLVVPLALVAVARPKAAWLAFGLGLALAGEMMRVWAAGHLVKAAELTTSGPFAHLRHPLYLGSLLIATGYCLMSGLWLSFPIVWALYALFFLSAIFQEEKALEAAFGDQYRRYRRQVPRLWPRLIPFPGGHGRFSNDKVRTNREARVALGVFITLALFLVRWVVLK